MFKHTQLNTFIYLSIKILQIFKKQFNFSYVNTILHSERRTCIRFHSCLC
ncbi:unnamed protein product [Paramecium sonneborni]|uniref:Uncharacterized protein n=1 Tax=Paramecium sonneborni TaxID=65129 RepID=A0A8S1MZ86_9CILI|nr:unnamed protein product [Paramecium sonneborni]CAD8083441.1 unnamed protein product [Paramecium sonneborni]